MTITSSAFQQNDPIPDEYSQNGDNKNPPLTFSEVPVEAKSLALIVEDPDAPNGTFTHWILYNMSPATMQIMEDELPETGAAGLNDSGTTEYLGPKPPSATHRYIFKLFALDKELDLDTPRSAHIYAAMDGHIINSAELIGLYTHKD